MITDWKSLGIRIGSIHADGRESGGDELARKALEDILGKEWIQAAVDHIAGYEKGTEVAMNCLCLLRSEQAVRYAYEVYKNTTGDKAARAVWLIKHIAHPTSFPWIEEFLANDHVSALGIGLLDQLLWTDAIPYDEKAESFLQLAERKGFHENVAFIRKYLREKG